MEQEQIKMVHRAFSSKEYPVAYFNRSLEEYLALFPDDSQEIKRVFTHHTMGKIFGFPKLSRNRVVLKTEPLFGGEEEFFREGSNLLDIGSGGGNAVAEISQHFLKVNVVGLDIRYGIHPPAGRKQIPQGSHNIPQYVAGTWEHFPFADNSFDRIISYFTIPTYLYEGNSKKEIQNILDETTRIAKNGALWRSAYSSPSPAHPDLFRDLLKRGWDIYTYSEEILIARLHK